MAPKVATGKKVEGGRRPVEWATLGLFHPNTVEARDRSEGLRGRSSSEIRQEIYFSDVTSQKTGD
uniref:Uncharacterized protein n=1 Tax=Lynx canadensis TaxID=61383 RepID=A0A667GNF3_LYNCA